MIHAYGTPLKPIVPNCDIIGFHPDRLAVIAGPCSVESQEQILEIATAVAEAGATHLRGGAFKPRTSPYDFQGLKEEGLKYLVRAREATGLPIVTEVLHESDVLLVAEYADILQVGARNCQNFGLLSALGKTNKPVLLKRGFGCKIAEHIMAAEYIKKEGNENILLCERGIRTFEDATRFTFDINAIPLMKRKSNWMVVADPSHGTGLSEIVPNIAYASVAAGADGLMVEVHKQPENAVSDGRQSLSLPAFSAMMDKLRTIASVMGKKI